MELNRLIQHPEEMDRETLYDLRALLALYPYYQTARLLMLKNLYLLHDPSFDEELRRAAIYISDRKVIFQMIEAAHYQLKRTQNKPQSMGILDAKKKEDRTSSLIDHFLDSIPTDAEENEKKKEKRKPTPADAAVDYVSYLMETETEQKMEQPSRTISLIDDFIEEGGFNLEKLTAQRNLNQNHQQTQSLQKQLLIMSLAIMAESLQKPLLESTSSRESMREPIRLSIACISNTHKRVPIM